MPWREHAPSDMSPHQTYPGNSYGVPKPMTQLRSSFFPQWVRQDVFIVTVVSIALLDLKGNE